MSSPVMKQREAFLEFAYDAIDQVTSLEHFTYMYEPDFTSPLSISLKEHSAQMHCVCNRAIA